MTEKRRERRSECCFHSDFSWSTTEQNEQGETPADPELFNEDRLHLCKLGCTWVWVCLCVCRPSWSTSMLFRLKTLSLPPSAAECCSDCWVITLTLYSFAPSTICINFFLFLLFGEREWEHFDLKERKKEKEKKKKKGKEKKLYVATRRGPQQLCVNL